MPAYFEFEASLAGIKPRIWRRFLLRADATFHDLHLAIQDAGPWENCHLFAFRENERSRPALATNAGRDFGPAAPRVALKTHFSDQGDRCVYEYDFGDSWIHRVLLKGVRDLPERFYRRLVDGKRAFPLEDSGSLPGYYACAAASGEVDPEELGLPETFVNEKREWMDPDWHPEAFDLESARQAFDLDQPPAPPSAEESGPPGEEDFFVGDLFPFDDDEGDEDFAGDLEDFDPLTLLEAAFRVPAGYAVPIPVPAEMRNLLLPVVSGHEPLAAAFRNARPDSPMVELTLAQAEDLIALVEAAAAEADGPTRARLDAMDEHLSRNILPYTETEDVEAIGLPSDEGFPPPLEAIILEVENALLVNWGLIDEAEFARRTGRTVADADQEVGVRLTGPQREAIREHVTLSDDLRQRLSPATSGIATVYAPLADLYELHDNLQATVGATTGNLKGKLRRALRRIREAIAPYMVPRPPGAGGNGDGA